MTLKMVMKNRAAHGVVAIGLAASIGVAAGAERGRIGDKQLMRGVSTELDEARGVDANGLDVQVTDGIVTLVGEVDNALAEERALRIAKMTRGALSVVDRLEVRETDRSDDEVLGEVRAAISDDPSADAYEVSVGVNDGVVTLRGTAESWAERRLAERVTKGVRGVREVENQIVVNPALERSDSEIEQDVVELMRWDTRLNARLIGVEAEGGAVTLSGRVGSAYERDLARQHAWMAGATDINAEDLSVAPWIGDEDSARSRRPDLSDKNVRNAISRAMVLQPRVYAPAVDIDVTEGAVTLTGGVDDLKAKRAAGQVASNTVGVRRVTNLLKVRPEIMRTPGAIAESVRGAVIRDPWLESREIDVSVDDAGRVRLWGEVDSYFERAEAEDIASRVLGVTGVRNMLEVPYDAAAYRGYLDWDPILYDFDYDYEVVEYLTDDEILEGVKDELFWSPFVDSDDIRVSVEGGAVTLTGTVEDRSEYNDAVENAMEGGADRVINRLKIAEE